MHKKTKFLLTEKEALELQKQIIIIHKSKKSFISIKKHITAILKYEIYRQHKIIVLIIVYF